MYIYIYIYIYLYTYIYKYLQKLKEFSLKKIDFKVSIEEFLFLFYLINMSIGDNSLSSN